MVALVSCKIIIIIIFIGHEEYFAKLLYLLIIILRCIIYNYFRNILKRKSDDNIQFPLQHKEEQYSDLQVGGKFIYSHHSL